MYWTACNHGTSRAYGARNEPLLSWFNRLAASQLSFWLVLGPEFPSKQHPESNTGRRWAGTMTVVTAVLGAGGATRLDLSTRELPGLCEPHVPGSTPPCRFQPKARGTPMQTSIEDTQFRSAVLVPYSARSDPAGLRRLRSSESAK